MQVLVAHATAYGFTKGIATAVADQLRDAGHVVDLRPIDEVASLVDVDAAVLGSAIHSGAWPTCPGETPITACEVGPSPLAFRSPRAPNGIGEGRCKPAGFPGAMGGA